MGDKENRRGGKKEQQQQEGMRRERREETRRNRENLDVIAVFVKLQPELLNFKSRLCQLDEQQAKHQLTDGSL
ncbi:hypothetical protein Q5P01_005589 [Channa striata]|uniref:Uncharacterized protein n=1 Tax=Channa striata TaxID=64152 RepID=A0AA88SZN1_CHASR|nr:hypothetical protein Q5P01_005589 [Channa striata]